MQGDIKKWKMHNQPFNLFDFCVLCGCLRLNSEYGPIAYSHIAMKRTITFWTTWCYLLFYTIIDTIDCYNTHEQCTATCVENMHHDTSISFTKSQKFIFNFYFFFFFPNSHLHTPLRKKRLIQLWTSFKRKDKIEISYGDSFKYNNCQKNWSEPLSREY
jgi:hypothetical protein